MLVDDIQSRPINSRSDLDRFTRGTASHRHGGRRRCPKHLRVVAEANYQNISIPRTLSPKPKFTKSRRTIQARHLNLVPSPNMRPISATLKHSPKNLAPARNPNLPCHLAFAKMARPTGRFITTRLELQRRRCPASQNCGAYRSHFHALEWQLELNSSLFRSPLPAAFDFFSKKAGRFERRHRVSQAGDECAGSLSLKRRRLNCCTGIGAKDQNNCGTIRHTVRRSNPHSRN